MGKVFWKLGNDENILKLGSSDGCCKFDFDNGCTIVKYTKTP